MNEQTEIPTHVISKKSPLFVCVVDQVGAEGGLDGAEADRGQVVRVW